MNLRWLPSVLAATLCISSIASSQAASNCNNSDRSISVQAGVQGTPITKTCAPALTISIGVASYTTAGPCEISSVFYHGAIYHCDGNDTTTGTNCIGGAYKVTYDTRTGGSCPNITGLTPGTFKKWSDVPLDLLGALSCTDPKVTSSYDTSSSVSQCKKGKKVLPKALNRSGNSGTYLVQPGIQPRTGGMGNMFYGDYEFAQSPGNLPGEPTLDSLCASYSDLGGAKMTADVEIRHYDTNDILTHSESATITGRINSDGRFDINETRILSGNGQSASIQRRIAYDGTTLFELSPGAETGNLYLESFPLYDTVAMDQVRFIRPLYWWVSNPVRIPRFDNSIFSSTTNASTITVTLWAEDGAGQPTPSADYKIAAPTLGAPEHPISRTVPDAMGIIRGKLMFEDPFALESGEWRPTRITRIALRDGISPERVEVQLTVTSAIRLTSSEAVAVPAAFAPNTFWNTWE